MERPVRLPQRVQTWANYIYFGNYDNSGLTEQLPAKGREARKDKEEDGKQDG